MMVPHLSERVREVALKHVLSVEDVVARRAVLAQMAKVWPVWIGASELDIIRRCLDGTDLDDCLDLLAAASDVLEGVAGADVHLACLDGIRTVQRWWPRFADDRQHLGCQ